MNYVMLPYLDSNAPLRAAFDEMERRDVRAVVAPMHEDGYRIYMNRDVLAALQQGKESCSDIDPEGGIRAIALNELPARQERWLFLYAPPPPDYTLADSIARTLEWFLDNRSATYGILLGDRPPANGGMVVVVTRHESYGDEITQARKVCFCDRNAKHECTEGSTCTGKECDYCDGTYYCR